MHLPTKLIFTATLLTGAVAAPLVIQPAPIVAQAKTKTNLHNLSAQPHFDHQTITVGVDPAIDPNEQAAIDQAIANWNQSGVVTLQRGPYEAHADILLDNRSLRGQANDTWLILGQTTHRTQGHQLIQSHVQIDPQSIDADTMFHVGYQRLLVNTITHELGHALGLPHIQNDHSIMNAMNHADISGYDYGLLDRLYSDPQSSTSRLYHLPMHQGFTINPANSAKGALKQ